MNGHEWNRVLQERGVKAEDLEPISARINGVGRNHLRQLATHLAV